MKEIHVRRIIGSSITAAIVAVAAAADSAEMTGTIAQIDPLAGNIVVTDVAGDAPRVFAVPEAGTAGVELEGLKEGDRVKIFYADTDRERGEPIDATQIDKIED